MTHSITFLDNRALVVFHSMAEGLSEVAADDEEFARASHLKDLIKLTGNTDTATWPFTVEISDELAEVARSVLENCHDNASGTKPDDPEAENYLFEGQVLIEEDDPPKAIIPLTELEARILAVLLFKATPKDHPELTAEIATRLLEKLRSAVFLH